MSLFAQVQLLALGAGGLAVVFVWSFCEGVIWPFVAELPLVVLLVTVGVGWRALLLISVSALGSLVGVATTWAIAESGRKSPIFFTHPRMLETARMGLIESPSKAFMQHMFNGVPVKAYAYQAGDLGIPLPVVLLSAWPRVTRIFIVGGGGVLLGVVSAGLLKDYLGWAMLFGGLGYLFILRLVVRNWR